MPARNVLPFSAAGGIWQLSRRDGFVMFKLALRHKSHFVRVQTAIIAGAGVVISMTGDLKPSRIRHSFLISIKTKNAELTHIPHHSSCNCTLRQHPFDLHWSGLRHSASSLRGSRLFRRLASLRVSSMSTFFRLGVRRGRTRQEDYKSERGFLLPRRMASWTQDPGEVTLTVT